MTKTAKPPRTPTAPTPAPSASAPRATTVAHTPASVPQPTPRSTDQRGATVATKVFVHAFSSGPRGCLSAMPLHEIVLCKRKLEIFGESLTLTVDWPEYVPREREMDAAELAEEHRRLQALYVFAVDDHHKYDLVQDVYGPAHQGRLRAVIRKQHQGWQDLTKKLDGQLLLEHWQDLALLADPEQDFIEPSDLVAKAEK